MSFLNCIVTRTLKKQVKLLAAPISNYNQAYPISSGILKSGLPDVEIPRIAIHEYVFENMGKWENHTAIKCAVTGRKYTYKQIRLKSKNLGVALRKKLKLNKGDVVSVLFPNVPEFFIAALGIPQGGLICTTVNPIYTPEEISRQLLDCSAKAIITLTDLWPLAKSTIGIMKKNIPIITVNTQQSQSTPSGAINFTEFVDNSSELDISISTEDVAFLPYSSGTTGLPKGVQLTHRNLISNVCQLIHPGIGGNREPTGEHQDVTPAVLPLYHIYGLTLLCLYQLRLGCQTITLTKFTPDLYIDILRREKPDVLYVAPPIAIFLANHPAVTCKDFDSVRAIINGAASLGVLNQEKLLKKIERYIPIQQGYGMTEASPVISALRLDFLSQESAIGSIGKPLPNTEVKVIAVDDSKGTPLGPNELGELLVRGPQVMKGYYNRPEENIFLDGWLRTGDMMYYNKDEFLFISDRLKELIKVKGFQVAPAELEEIIRDFPKVAEVAVIGIPNSALGEAPRAYVVPQPNAKIDCDKLFDYVKGKVAPYKQLVGGIIIVDSIPKNMNGKIMRREIKLQYQASGV